MKKVIFGSALLISGVILLSLSMIGASLASGNQLFSILFILGAAGSIVGVCFGFSGMLEK